MRVVMSLVEIGLLSLFLIGSGSLKASAALLYLNGLCHGFYQMFEQPKFLFVSQKTQK